MARLDRHQVSSAGTRAIYDDLSKLGAKAHILSRDCALVGLILRLVSQKSPETMSFTTFLRYTSTFSL